MGIIHAAAAGEDRGETVSPLKTCIIHAAAAGEFLCPVGHLCNNRIIHAAAVGDEVTPKKAPEYHPRGGEAGPRTL